MKSSAKGVRKSVKRTLNHDLFTSIIQSKTKVCRINTKIRSQQHQLVVAQVNKTALSAFDDMRFLLDCGVESLAYGHHSLNQSSNSAIFSKLLSLKCLMHQFVNFKRCFVCLSDVLEPSYPNLLSTSSAEDDEDSDDGGDDSTLSSFLCKVTATVHPHSLESVYSMFIRNIYFLSFKTFRKSAFFN